MQIFYCFAAGLLVFHPKVAHRFHLPLEISFEGWSLQYLAIISYQLHFCEQFIFFSVTTDDSLKPRAQPTFDPPVLVG